MPGWIETIRASVSGLFKDKTDNEEARARRPHVAAGSSRPIVESPTERPSASALAQLSEPWVDCPLDETTAREEGLTIHDRDLGKDQGRENRHDWLEVGEFDPKLPRHVRGWLQNQRRHVERGDKERSDTPPGYELAHGRTTPAREGFDYSNAKFQNEDLNDTEESVRRRVECDRRRGQDGK